MTGTATTGLSSMATASLLADLADRLSERGLSIRFSSAGGVEVARRIRAGERADVVVLAADALAALEADGWLVAGTVRPLFRSSVVLAVAADAESPALDTEDDLAAVLRSARRIGYSTGPSGTALLDLLDRWGLREEVSGRLLQAPPGVPVASLVADGTAEVGVQQNSEFIADPGVHVVGPLPGDAAVTSTFSGAVLASSHRVEAALAVLDALSGDDLVPAVRAAGLQPAG